MRKRLITYRNGGRVSAEGSLHTIPYIDLFDYLVSMAVAFEQYELSHWILLLVPLSSARRVVLLGNLIGSLHRAGDSLRGAERWLEASDGEVAEPRRRPRGSVSMHIRPVFNQDYMFSDSTVTIFKSYLMTLNSWTSSTVSG